MNMKAYKESRNWSDKFIPRIKEIVGPLLLENAPEIEDTKFNTDLMVLKAKDKRIACRMRRHSHISYNDEITIRSKSKYGGETEIHKIMKGYGDWMFYGFSNKDETDIQHWRIICLNRVRKGIERGLLTHGDKDNFDGTAFKWIKVKPQIVLYSSDEVEQPQLL